MRVYFKDKKWTVYKFLCITIILSTGILLSGCDKEIHNNVESISAEMRSLDELLQMIFDGTIRDAKTAAGILAYYARIR